jgi:hypothetical protein
MYASHISAQRFGQAVGQARRTRAACSKRSSLGQGATADALEELRRQNEDLRKLLHAVQAKSGVSTSWAAVTGAVH